MEIAELEEALAGRPRIRVHKTKYRGDYLTYYARINLYITPEKNYEIFCRYRPTLVWKKVAPMRWQLTRWPKLPNGPQVRYIDSGIYSTSKIGSRMWSNDTCVDWRCRTYLEKIFCAHTVKGEYAYPFDYCRYRVTRGSNNVAKGNWETHEVIQTIEEHHALVKKTVWI